jgi:peptide-methionine (R)-S-oxide reductase
MLAPPSGISPILEKPSVKRAAGFATKNGVGHTLSFAPSAGLHPKRCRARYTHRMEPQSLTRRSLLAFAVAFGIAGTRARAAEHFEVTYSDAQWRRRLSPAAYAVLRREGTELPGTSKLLDEHRHGTFACAGCNLALFSSDTKFDSGTGWPSFFRPLPNAVETQTDRSLLEERTEVHCRRCGSHIGHVFDDGPPPTGLRYCMNGVALVFHPR